MEKQLNDGILVKVRCYARDSEGYFTQLTDCNFNIDLSQNLRPLVEYISEHLPTEKDSDSDSNSHQFTCYAGDFTGESINITLMPTEVEYLVKAFREQRKPILIVCQEPKQLSGDYTRYRLSSPHLSASKLAKDFNSFSSIESSSSDTSSSSQMHFSPPPEPIGEDEEAFFKETKDDISVHVVSSQKQNKHRMLVIPSPPSTKPLKKGHNPLTASKSAIDVKNLTPVPKKKIDRKSKTISRFWPQPQSEAAESYSDTNCIKQQHIQVSKQNKVMTLDRTCTTIQTSPSLDGNFTYTSGKLQQKISISSPIQQMTQPPSPEKTEGQQFKRGTAIRGRRISDLGIALELPFEEMLPVECHVEGLQTEPSEVQVLVKNYRTVNELKIAISEKLRQISPSLFRTLAPSNLVLFYVHEGRKYELLFNQQFLLSTYFYKLLTESKQPKLHVQLARPLPKQELRLLYRISQLTGILLDSSVCTQGLSVSSLTSIPGPDQHEVQDARRSLHSFLRNIVTQRNEEEYSLCKTLASREASLSLALMIPADNKIKITFHYKTVFSLDRRLYVYTYASKALSELFPCLVACGLVTGRLEDHTLQVSGEESYIHGDHELLGFTHIRKRIMKGEPVHLSVTEKPPFEVDRPHKFSLLPLDPLSNSSMCHSALSSSPPISRQETSSVWEIYNKLRMDKLHITNFPTHLVGCRAVHMKLQLLHGSQELCPAIKSTTKLPASEVVWEEQLEFESEIRNIPKAAKILFSFMDGTGQKSPSKPKFLYWGMLSVFDHCGHLISGKYHLHLWQGVGIKESLDETVSPNPAIFASNNPHSKPVQLMVRLQCNPVPVIYPSTSSLSCSVILRQHPSLANVTIRRQYKSMLAILIKDRLYKKVPHYIEAIHWNDVTEVIEVFQFLEKLEGTIEDIPAEVAIRLLDSDFPDECVRNFAVRALEGLPDEQLEDFLIQLVQALKFEAHHDSALARFLLKRALTNKIIGHFFFWYLKSEMHNSLYMARYSVILEAYLMGCGEYCLTMFADQVDIQISLCNMGLNLRRATGNGRDLEKMQNLLPLQLMELEASRYVFIPVYNPRHKLGNLKPTKCKVMSSAKRPMWLELYNIHPSALSQSPTRLILKLGDDLRQDMITLRMFSLFEKLWEEQGLDLELIPYGCMATGPKIGFIEVVKNAKTIAEVSSVRDSSKLFEWIKSHQKNEFEETDQEKLEAAVKRFTRSCAGYSVATYVLGIGDRHNDNIMVTTSGNLFHIDFGHFLGNIKYYMGFKREWAPFVLTPDFVYVMGGENSEMFEMYKNLCCRAFLTLRRHADLIINLFSLMRSTGIPELTCVEDTDYIRNVLVTNKPEQMADKTFRKVIQRCLDLKWTVQIMWKIHILRHGS